MVNLFGYRTHGKKTIDIAPVVVLGLGRFGLSLGEELILHGVEVMGIDRQERLVNSAAKEFTHCVAADTTDIEALRQLGLEDVERAVVAIGSNLEASILTASNLVELGVQDIWAKADSDAHARILQQVGVHHVIRPERDTGRRVAHLLDGRFEEFVEFDEEFGVIKMPPPGKIKDRENINEWIFDDYGVYLASVHVPGVGWRSPSAFPLREADLALFAGEPSNLEEFARDAAT